MPAAAATAVYSGMSTAVPAGRPAVVMPSTAPFFRTNQRAIRLLVVIWQ